MKLKIYKISHPLIKLMLTRMETEYLSAIDKKYYERYIGFFVIYEILRKYMIIKNLHIQLLEGSKKIETIDIRTKYIILTNLSDTYSMISEIKFITSNVHIIHTEYEDINKIKNYLERIGKIDNNSYIFIIEKTTKNYKIINLIDYLKNTSHIALSKISIGNILSDSTILKKIGEQYPELKVYTTQIK
uniref:Uracil phosphoribosyltransferase n=1 Tax=Leptosiphonia brodiei TaxID=2608611 RepID=A0A1Z1MA86_9FLOR|nr:uracil phosphoribosyltransferase [Leptosiphonia brodiei]ARW63007.1 uracil phosphoribosyltransferase [Leptosiphonia brodiei]